MALYSTGGASILSAEQVAALVVQPLLDQSVAAQISTVVSTSSHNLRIPVVATDPAAAWTAESLEIAVSDPVLTEVNVALEAGRFGRGQQPELAADSSPAALQVGDGLVRDLRAQDGRRLFRRGRAERASGDRLTGGQYGQRGRCVDQPGLGGSRDRSGREFTYRDHRVRHQPGDGVELEHVEGPPQPRISRCCKLIRRSRCRAPSAACRCTVSPSVGADLVWAVPAAHSIFVIRQDASVVSDTSAMFTSDRTAIRATLRIGLASCIRPPNENHQSLRAQGLCPIEW